MSTAAATAAAESVVVTCGIDVGSLETKIVLGPGLGCEIVRNQVGGHVTPTAVSFDSNGARQIGATANKKDAKALVMLNRYLTGEKGDSFADFDVTNTNSQGLVPVEIKGETSDLSPSAVVAMLLGNVGKSVVNTIERVSGKPATDFDISYVFSVGPGMAPEAQLGLLNAAYAAGMTTASIVESAHCYSQTLDRKFPDAGERTVLLVDMGHTQTTLSVVQMGKMHGTQEKKDGEDEAVPGSSTTVLRSLRHKSLGALSIDMRLWHHFQSSIPALKEVTPKSRSGRRLLDGCQKLKHLLSQLTDGSVTVENIQDTDVRLTLSRQVLTELCQNEAEALKQLIHKAVDGVDKIDVVEVVGGGCRIPWVKDMVLDEVAGVETLSHSLDDTSGALGAALLLTNPPTSEGILKLSSKEASQDIMEQRETLLHAEQAMANHDEEIHALGDLKNKLEAHILEMRSAKHGKLGEHMPEALDTYLDDLDNWLFSEEAGQISKADLEDKLKAIIDKTQELCSEYFDAKRREVEAKDLEMEEEAKRAQAERNGQEEEDQEDHDNRRLPKKRRMDIVMKNKAEANELFSHGNFKFAAARYTKALTHCTKFVDLSPEDITEVTGVKLSLNLNLALAYYKLENYDQALRVCNDALELDPESAKALYRRASVYYEKKNWESAKKDIKKAVSLAEDDKAIKKLQERIEAQMKRQKAKEKKMAQKMFG